MVPYSSAPKVLSKSFVRLYVRRSFVLLQILILPRLGPGRRTDGSADGAPALAKLKFAFWVVELAKIYNFRENLQFWRKSEILAKICNFGENLKFGENLESFSAGP